VREETLKAMNAVINRDSPYTGYVVEMLQGINYLERRNLSIQARLPALPYIHDEMPPDIGYVYMIVSLKDHRVGYVGQTKCFRRRLMEHNSEMGGSVQTRAMKPWVPVVLITGFDDAPNDAAYGGDANKHWREEFERLWCKRNSTPGFEATNSVWMLRNGRTVFGWMERDLPRLKWRQLGRLTENGEI
jgi:predicted GIY-YIG superfamily endonuclease